MLFFFRRAILNHQNPRTMKRRFTTILISLMSIPLFGQGDSEKITTEDISINAVFNSGNYNRQEVNRRLQKLESQLALQSQFTAALLEAHSTINESSEMNRRARLLQNAPGPSHHITTIHFQLPEDVLAASIKLHNANGILVATFDEILNRGHVTIERSTLSPGMYYYSLIINGKVSDTKKLIVTK